MTQNPVPGFRVEKGQGWSIRCSLGFVHDDHDGPYCHCSYDALRVTAALLGQVRVTRGVSIRMCRDCHRAFGLASTLYGDVVCDDGCAIHTFHHGRSACPH
jgi:hypothetical protein